MWTSAQDAIPLHHNGSSICRQPPPGTLEAMMAARTPGDSGQLEVVGTGGYLSSLARMHRAPGQRDPDVVLIDAALAAAQAAGEPVDLIRQVKALAPTSCVILVAEDANAYVTAAAHLAGAAAVLPRRRVTEDAVALIAKYAQQAARPVHADD